VAMGHDPEQRHKRRWSGRRLIFVTDASAKARIHVRLFIGSKADVTHAKAGHLCFRADEWEAFVRQHAQAEGHTVIFAESHLSGIGCQEREGGH
jgi:hypothetical protein